MAAPSPPPSRRVGLLFDQDYDAIAHARLENAALRFDRRGFDAAGLLGKLGIPGFDIDRFADLQARRARRQRWAGVLSHHEFQGALVASLVAERCGLPGTSPESILACQHKLYARQVLQQVCPQANVAYVALDPLRGGSHADALSFPCHVKPARGTFSILSRRVASGDEFARLTNFSAVERWTLRRMLGPFDRIAAERLPHAGSTLRLIVEEELTGTQHNLDGWVDERGVHLLGVVDAHMYPGTEAFQRWHYPSALPVPAQMAALDVARRFLTTAGFTRGMFNMEFFHDPASGRTSVLEFNPRLSSQFGDLYRLVDGIDPHAMAVALALGDDVRTAERIAPVAGVAASLVWRSFGSARPPRLPDRRTRAVFAQSFPEASLITYPRALSLLARGARWLDSHRYGVVNLGAADLDELRLRCATVSALLGWPDAPYADGLPAQHAQRATTAPRMPVRRDTARTVPPAPPSSRAAPPAPAAVSAPTAPADSLPVRTTTALPAEPTPHA